MFLNSDNCNPAEQTIVVFTFKQCKILQFSLKSTVFIQMSTKFPIYHSLQTSYFRYMLPSFSRELKFRSRIEDLNPDRDK